MYTILRVVDIKNKNVIHYVQYTNATSAKKGGRVPLELPALKSGMGKKLMSTALLLLHPSKLSMNDDMMLTQLSLSLSHSGKPASFDIPPFALCFFFFQFFLGVFLPSVIIQLSESLGNQALEPNELRDARRHRGGGAGKWWAVFFFCNLRILHKKPRTISDVPGGGADEGRRRDERWEGIMGGLVLYASYLFAFSFILFFSFLAGISVG